MREAVVPLRTKYVSRITYHEFMTDILNKTIVLVLNRNWQAINVRTPQEAFCHDGHQRGHRRSRSSWRQCPRKHSAPSRGTSGSRCRFVRRTTPCSTVRGAIRVPTVIVAVNYAKVPKKRPKLCAKNIRERDGNRCQYTGKLLQPGRRQPRPRRAPLARRQGRVGKPRLVEQGREPAQGRPPAARGRPEAAHASRARRRNCR